MTQNNEALQSGEKAALYLLAEQLLDDQEQLAHYNQAKWNLVGDPDPERRREGRMPWLTRRDGQGALRAYTLDVFSGFSTETGTILTIRKDLWCDTQDPATWLAMETNLQTGETVQHSVWSASVDAARQMWLEIAPEGADNQPVWMENGVRKQAFRYKPRYDQTRFTARLDSDWQTHEIELKKGIYGSPIVYEDITALESMIIAVQQVRAAQHGRRELVPVAPAQELHMAA